MRLSDWVYRVGAMINFLICAYSIAIGRWDLAIVPALSGLTLEIARNLR